MASGVPETYWCSRLLGIHRGWPLGDPKRKTWGFVVLWSPGRFLWAGSQG